MWHPDFSELGPIACPYPIGPENFIGKVEVPKTPKMNNKQSCGEIGVSFDK